MRQLDFFLDADPADLVLPRGPLVSTRDVAKALGKSRRQVTKDVMGLRLDAFSFADDRGAYFVPRPSAVAFLRAEGVF